MVLMQAEIVSEPFLVLRLYKNNGYMTICWVQKLGEISVKMNLFVKNVAKIIGMNYKIDKK